MKILITGDWHIDNKVPKRRTDDYWKTVLRKLGHIIKLYKTHNCDCILQPGDFFNSHRANDYLKSTMIDYFKGINVFGVYGQHDLRFHNANRENTPLNVLSTAGTVKILTPEHHTFKGHLYGCNWGENISKPKEDALNILVMHKMVIKDENSKLWNDQSEYITAGSLNKLDFDLIVTGDNHQGFQLDKVYNCGSLMRSTIAQEDHKPHVWIWDGDKNDHEAEKLFIPIDPIEDVMDMETAIAEKERNEELEAFVNGLKDDPSTQDLNFLKSLYEYIKKNNIQEPVAKIIEQAIGENS